MDLHERKVAKARTADAIADQQYTLVPTPEGAMAIPNVALSAILDQATAHFAAQLGKAGHRG